MAFGFLIEHAYSLPFETVGQRNWSLFIIFTQPLVGFNMILPILSPTTCVFKFAGPQNPPTKVPFWNSRASFSINSFIHPLNITYFDQKNYIYNIYIYTFFSLNFINYNTSWWILFGVDKVTILFRSQQGSLWNSPRLALPGPRDAIGEGGALFCNAGFQEWKEATKTNSNNSSHTGIELYENTYIYRIYRVWWGGVLPSKGCEATLPDVRNQGFSPRIRGKGTVNLFDISTTVFSIWQSNIAGWTNLDNHYVFMANIDIHHGIRRWNRFCPPNNSIVRRDLNPHDSGTKTGTEPC